MVWLELKLTLQSAALTKTCAGGEFERLDELLEEVVCAADKLRVLAGWQEAEDAVWLPQPEMPVITPLLPTQRKAVEQAEQMAQAAVDVAVRLAIEGLSFDRGAIERALRVLRATESGVRRIDRVRRIAPDAAACIPGPPDLI
jgi:hypothetical protein